MRFQLIFYSVPDHFIPELSTNKCITLVFVERALVGIIFSLLKRRLSVDMSGIFQLSVAKDNRLSSKPIV